MSDERTCRGRRPSSAGALKHHDHACYLRCDVPPPPAYRETVEQWILAHAERVARDLAALAGAGRGEDDS